jgi:exodeoxyribonuclease VII small subunit
VSGETGQPGRLKQRDRSVRRLANADVMNWIPMDPTIKDFESAIAELETIVKRLEEGDLALEKSLELFERGVQLSRFCHSKLEEAERRVEILTERGEVRPAPASLMAANDDEDDRPR